ncbi:autotransporter outer membrane beta-barrel domain-containing protein [Jeongeupia sp. USM3]|nr:autotransporter outer membrane beta-barrel domain-containing protein [Jeongeupia sp. USM3]
MVLFSGVAASSAQAACSATAPASGATVNCSGNDVSSVAARAGSTGVTIDLDSTATGSLSRSGSPVAFSVDTDSTIRNDGSVSLTGGGGSGGNRGAVLLGSGNGNRLSNTGTVGTTGAYNDGMAANGSGNTLTNNGSITTTGPNAYGMTAAWGQTNAGQSGNTLVNTGTVSTSGSNARAMSILGGNGTVRNSGMLSTSGASSTTVYMQGNNDTLINTGTITASGAGAEAVFSNTVGSSFTARIENGTGGRIVSQKGIGIRTLNGNTTIVNAGLVQSDIGNAIAMGAGNNTLILQTGSQIVGTADGGANNNEVILQGSGTAANAFSNFQTLLMQGSDWQWQGSGTFTLAHVQTGTLDLTGKLGESASAIVDAGATLQANAGNLPANVSNDGLVRFAQDVAGSYGGRISGAGVVEKTGAGTLTLAGGNSYSGGTILGQGTLAIGADSALGAASGKLDFNGGTLQLNQSLDLAGTRAITLDGGGGTIDTQGYSSTLAQGITGSGALTKAGSGSLLLNGVSSYAGPTTVAAGTLAVGDAAHTNAAIGGATTVAAGATLGGYGRVGGAVNNNGTIAVANALFSSGGNGAFTISGGLDNAGVVQIGGQGVGNRLHIVGDYVGRDGRIALNTHVAGDGAASDRLVVDGGRASGATTLAVTNVGGAGAQTVGDGIQLVQAVNGATSDAGAFRLAAPVKAGAFEYYLAKGGVSDGTAGNWYLRNSVAAEPLPAEPPVAAPATSPPLPAPPPVGADPIPLYRAEVPLYAAAPGVARVIGIMQTDNFHDRQGEQSLLTEVGSLPAAWARAWGAQSELNRQGTVDPAFDGSIYGTQLGQDLYAGTDGHRYGVFLGFARASGDVDGFALGTPELDVGRLAVNAYSGGVYWTHAGPGGRYVDALLMGSSLNVEPRSRDGVTASTRGRMVTGSIEAGLPVGGGEGWAVEPQAQLIWQYLSLNDLNDGISTVGFNDGNTFVGRVGARVHGRFDARGAQWQPYLRLNVLRTFGSDDTAAFSGGTDIETQVGQTTGQLGAGVVAKLGASASAFVSVSWLANLGGEHQRQLAGNAGVRWAW